ncbi:putative lipid II flippase FtsW [Wenzhouxiangella sp. AB-CW3]|uniref:putative lipid II flippase FtsW n=1 Tax=Wenzhouxiangella sp. AB-CW3 TaxID=2771012 RepID=UPI00168BBD09|nr:putative lipid II flippase FtsW [Wenzhouxiangella sp. AB-CW3]QOC23198.1 putative lipid II flippase FtsW [Wenzhouxiangella sp. AB-CW3]
MSSAISRRQARRSGEIPAGVDLDAGLVLSTVGLLGIGVVMVASTSMAVAESYAVSGWHFIARHIIYIGLGIAAAGLFRFVGTRHLQALAPLCFPLAVVLLLLPFIPGLGHEVNGSLRWIDLGFTRFQVVEAVKLILIVFVAGYLARRPELGRGRFLEIIKPLLVVGLLSIILLRQPDMGSAVILVAITGGMIWLAGAAWKHLFVLGLGSVPLLTFAALEPYRFQRVMTFVDPWADPFNSGFQLTQALIAVGRGQITGVGMGASVQKLYYLPEAHTDFIFAVLAEEFGLIGIVLVMVLFAVLIGRIFAIGLKARAMERPFAAFLVWGVGLWIGFQALVSMGVNLGMLPTKGLTLPLISAGGSSLIMTLIGIGLVLRVHWELSVAQRQTPRRRRGWQV